MIYRLTLAYDGHRFAGWQRQDNALTVQQAVEEALADLLGEAPRLHGAGRTDTGVHARGQVAHVDLPRPFPVKGLVHGTNHRLRSDVRVLAADRMPDGFHARKSALGKEYRYRIHRGMVSAPFETPFTLRLARPLDLVALRQGLEVLPGRHDFSAIAAAGGSHVQPWRRLFAAIAEEHGREIHLRFVGEGFLRGMVRALVGTLVEIGVGQRPAGDLPQLLEPGRQRSEAGFAAPAHGLCLERVFYPPAWRPLESHRG